MSGYLYECNSRNYWNIKSDNNIENKEYQPIISRQVFKIWLIINHVQM